MPVTNYDAAMAQQEYQNLVRQQSADIRARISAEQNAANALGVKYIATMGTSKPMQTDGNNYDSAMARQTYNNLMQQQMAFLDAQRAAQNAPTSPTGFGSMAAQLQARNMLPSQNQQQNVPTLMPIQTPQSAAANQALSQAGLGGGIPSPVQQGTAQQQQAMQNYQNFLSQGTANYQAAMQQPIPIQMPVVQQGQQPTQFGQVNQQAMQNFNNLLQNGMSNAGIYQSLRPPVSQIGPARPKPNPSISQNFGSIAGGFKNIVPKFSF